MNRLRKQCLPILIFDDDVWRAHSTRRVLSDSTRCVSSYDDDVRVILASKRIDVMRWMGTDSADLLLVREDALSRVSPTLIQDLRWYERAHHQRRHPVLALTDTLNAGCRLPVDGILNLSGDTDVLASELRYWFEHARAVRWLAIKDEEEKTWE